MSKLHPAKPWGNSLWEIPKHHLHFCRLKCFFRYLHFKIYSQYPLKYLSSGWLGSFFEKISFWNSLIMQIFMRWTTLFRNRMKAEESRNLFLRISPKRWAESRSRFWTFWTPFLWQMKTFSSILYTETFLVHNAQNVINNVMYLFEIEKKMIITLACAASCKIWKISACITGLIRASTFSNAWNELIYQFANC